MKLTLVIFSLLIIAIATKTIEQDQIQVPSWPEKYQNDFKVSSGFLKTINGKSHYMFLTKYQSEKVEEEPIVLWLNGGKGCSGLQGLFQEIGPYRMEYPKETFPSTVDGQNKYAWNRYANLLFIEAPLFTGFSTSDSQFKDYKPGDEQTADELFTALQNFFKENPDFENSKQKFLIGGEGLAGQYIPLLAQKILDANGDKKVGDSGFINLTSIVLGNAMLADNTNADFWEHYHSIEFLDEHGLYGPQMDDLWYKCVSDSLTDPSCEYFAEKNSSTKVQLNPYNFYAECQNVPSSPKEFEEDESENAYCMNWQPLEKYMEKNAKIFSDGESQYWQVCHAATQMKYENLEGGSFPLVESILQDTDVTLILYSGLSDTTVPYLTTEQYYHDLKRKLKAEETLYIERFLTEEGQVGGWTNSCGNFQYVKVRGAGHQVPADQPAAAARIIQAAINGDEVE